MFSISNGRDDILACACLLMFVCCVGVVCFCDLNQEICNRITSYNWPAAEERDWKGYSEKTKNKTKLEKPTLLRVLE